MYCTVESVHSKRIVESALLLNKKMLDPPPTCDPPRGLQMVHRTKYTVLRGTVHHEETLLVLVLVLPLKMWLNTQGGCAVCHATVYEALVQAPLLCQAVA